MPKVRREKVTARLEIIKLAQRLKKSSREENQFIANPRAYLQKTGLVSLKKLGIKIMTPQGLVRELSKVKGLVLFVPVDPNDPRVPDIVRPMGCAHLHLRSCRWVH